MILTISVKGKRLSHPRRDCFLARTDDSEIHIFYNIISRYTRDRKIVLVCDCRE